MMHPSRRTALLGGVAAAVVGALPGSKAHAEVGVRPALPIPSELGPNADGMIALDSRLGSMRFQGDQDTATFGVNGPCPQEIMRLPPFDQPLPLLTVRPDGADGNGRLPSHLATLPPLPDEPPPVSQQLVMSMFDDKSGMMLLDRAGLIPMSGTSKMDLRSSPTSPT